MKKREIEIINEKYRERDTERDLEFFLGEKNEIHIEKEPKGKRDSERYLESRKIIL